MKTLLIVDYEEIGAMLYNYAKMLQRHDGLFTCYYASFQNTQRRSHDSNAFHFGKPVNSWDLTKIFEDQCCGVTLFNAESKITYLKELADRLAPDLILTAGRGGYLCHQAGLGYVYWVYGSDVEQYAFNLTGSEANQSLKQKFIYQLVNSPFPAPDHPLLLDRLTNNIWAKGVRQADCLIVLPRTLRYLSKLVTQARLVHLPHCMPVVAEKPGEPSRKLISKKVFLSTTRHVWGKEQQALTDYKANDVFVNAVAGYRANSGDDAFELHLVRKGPQVCSTQRLLEKLKLDGHTVWHDEMKKEDVFRLYNQATVCFGQFGTEALEWSAIEPLAFGVPSISWYGMMEVPPLKATPFYKQKPPVFNSRSADDIAAHLSHILSDSDRYDAASVAARDWCRENCSVESLEASLGQMIDCVSADPNFHIDGYWSAMGLPSVEDQLERWMALAHEICGDHPDSQSRVTC